MAIDRDRLRQLSVEPAARQTGIGALPRSIHKIPGLREWVTLESVALVPVPVKRGDTWRIVYLLAVPTKLEDGSAGWIAPWGSVEWSWPQQRVIQKIDLRQQPTTAKLRSSHSISAQPSDATVKLDSSSRTLRENALFGTLDTILTTPGNDNSDLALLAGHYAGLLPTAIYPYYHALIPESIEWLRPNAQMPISPSLQQQRQPTNFLKNVPQDQAVVSPETTTPSLSSQSKYSPDLMEQMGPWLRQSIALANVNSLTKVVAQLQALDIRRRQPGFRLAFVGEFSRGKSTLVNRLFERSLLPIGDTPTTATLTSIVSGYEERMEVQWSQDHKEMRSLDEASWQDLLAANQNNSDLEVVARVRITLDDEWLQTLDLEIIDTPGAGDLSERRAALVFDLLSQCDAAVLVISATLPFSLTEAAFLEEKVIGHHIPRVLVAVSKLDTVAIAKREDVMRVVQQRVNQIQSGIPVLPIHPIAPDTSEEETLEVLRSQIETMVTRDDRRVWRGRQLAMQLTDQLNLLIQIDEEALITARMNATERQQALQKAQAQTQKAALHWDNIQLELDRRRLQHDQALRQKILDAKTELLDLLTYELHKAPDPKTWWERDLPFRLRRELAAYGRKSENFVFTSLTQDFEWLQREAAQTFGTQMTTNVTHSQPNPEIAPDFNQVPLTDVRRFRWLARIGSSLAMVGGYLLGGPAGIAAGVGTGILGEHLLNKQLDEQRHLMTQELQQALDRAIDEYCIRVSERLHQLYCQLTENIKQEQMTWKAARQVALNREDSSDEAQWQQMIQEAKELREKILAALKQP